MRSISIGCASEHARSVRRSQPARLRRVAIDLSREMCATSFAASRDIELPRINEERCYLRRYRFVYGIASSEGSLR